MQELHVTWWQYLCAWAYDHLPMGWLWRYSQAGYIYLAVQSYHVYSVRAYRRHA